MNTDLLKELPIEITKDVTATPAIEVVHSKTDKGDTLRLVPRATANVRPTRVRLQADTARWDRFWERHGVGEGLFDKLLWPTRKIFSGRHANLLLRYMNRHSKLYRKSVRVLEIGCGSATTSSFIAQKAPKTMIFGADLSQAAIKVAQARNPNLYCVVADAMALPFAREKFSLVFSSGVIEHFDRKIADQMLVEHSRVTRNGGTVGLIVPWRHTPYNLLRILCGARWPFGHESPFSIGELRKFTRNHSIDTVEVKVSYGATLTAAGTKQEDLALRMIDASTTRQEQVLRFPVRKIRI